MSTQGGVKRRGAPTTDKPVKRTRVSRACDQCRIAREKCDGTQPTCSTCSTSKRQCTYAAIVKKRGIQPGYIRALELALACLFQHDPENENLINEKLAQGGSSSLLLSRDSKESNKLHKRWRKARFYTDVDKLLSGGGTSRRDPSESSSSDDEEEERDIRGSATTTQNRVEEGSALLRSLDSAATTPLQALPLNSWKLFETYFTYIQCWLPICEKHDVLRLSYSYHAEGLVLSSDLPDSGAHAELWSMLAVASIQESNYAAISSSSDTSSMTPSQLYSTAKSLVPEEAGRFDIGHVKALLNLSIFNIAQGTMEAAWLLVAYASRILDLMDKAPLQVNPRYKHTLYGCFMLDSILAMTFRRRPYFRAGDVRQLGKIDDDGLDEWQPWAGQPQSQQSRSPVLALSTLNAMTELMCLLGDGERSVLDKVQQLKAWETSLPSKLYHICSPAPPPSLNPPAVLLQLAFQCIALTVTSSQSWLLRSLNLLEQAQDQISWESLPPILRCLLDFVKRQSSSVSSSHEIQSRLTTLESKMNEAWRPDRGPEARPDTLTLRANPATQTVDANEMLTSLMNTQHHHAPARSNTQSALSPFDLALSQPQLMGTPATELNAPQDVSISNDAIFHHMELPNDVESFFDELASLDTMNSLNTQPQFVQNLGFASGANMADLFSKYIPMQTSTFMGHEETEGVNLDHFGFENFD